MANTFTQIHIHAVFAVQNRQEEHHKRRSFLEEYQKILKDLDLEYDERYIFTSIEEQDAFLRNAVFGGALFFYRAIHS